MVDVIEISITHEYMLVWMEFKRIFTLYNGINVMHKMAKYMHDLELLKYFAQILYFVSLL